MDEIKAIMVAQVLLDRLLPNCGQHIPIVREQQSCSNRTMILHCWSVVNLHKIDKGLVINLLKIIKLIQSLNKQD